MNNQDEMILELKEYIIELSGKAKQEIVFDKKLSLIEDLDLDSIAIVELVVFIEERFGINSDDDELIDKLDDFNKLVEYISAC